MALKGDISRLSVPAEQLPPVQLSEDEDELQESSEVSLTFWECPASLTCLLLQPCWSFASCMSHGIRSMLNDLPKQQKPPRLHLPQAMQGYGESPHL